MKLKFKNHDCFEKNPQDWMAWNVACASTHLNKIDAAFCYLELAINLGFDNLEHLENSDQVTPLKKDPRWGELITRFKNEKLSTQKNL